MMLYLIGIFDHKIVLYICWQASEYQTFIDEDPVNW
jgi:hypothetical protein